MCLGVCGCGFTEPLFYNVADCFGDQSSTVCTGNDGKVDTVNTYLPQEVWENDCKGNQECTLSFDGDEYSCYNDDDMITNIYYTSINGVDFDRFEEVVTDNHMAICNQMQFKVLGVCQSV